MILLEPQSAEDFAAYYELRWRILRKPWHQPKGSEQDEQDKSAYHIMARHDSRTVGVARLEFPLPGCAQLRYMAVDDDFQGKGTGKLILAHMEQYARQQQTKQLFLHARENAVGFYLNVDYGIEETSYLLFNSIQHYKMIKTL